MSLSPLLVAGVAVAFLGLAGVALVVMALGRARIMRVPDGDTPDAHYRHWKKGGLSRKLGRGWLFVSAASVAMACGGCTAAAGGWLLQ